MSLRRHEQQAIARVEKAGVLQGTAFIVADTYAITARHVVRDIADGRVDLVFSDPAAKLGAKVVHPTKAKLKEPPDWALLELDTKVSRRPLRVQRSWQSNAWVSYGFGNFYVEGKPLPGGGLSGQIVVQAGLQLQCQQLEGKRAEDAKGFSGAPVIVSRAVIGVISNARKNTKTKKIKGGLNAVEMAQIFDDWPEKHEQPDERPFVLIAALTFALRGKDTSDLARRLGLTGQVSETDIAESLTERSYDDAKKALRNLELGTDPRITRLIETLWIHPDAGAQLHATLGGERPVAAIRTKSTTTVRHHLMRAHGVDRDGDMITWGDPPHMINLVPTGEALDALIEHGAKAAYNCSRETALERLNDPEFEPAIFTIADVPDDDDIASAAALCPERKPRIVAYTGEMSIEYLKMRRLTATLIEPFPDAAVDKKLAEKDAGVKEGQ